MQPPGTFHMHTVWSDGTGTIDEMAAAAAAQGFATLGISDHFGLYADGREVFGMRKEQFDGYVAAVRAAQAQASPRLLLGLELDYAPGGEALVQAYLARAPFDYVIGSVHFLDDFPIDYAPEPWQKLSPAEVDDAFRRYWQTVRQVAGTGMVDLIGHLDLPKKFNITPTVEPRREREEALDAIAAAGLPIEINTAGWDKPCRDAYPAEPLLAECWRRRIPVMVSDDAHTPGQVGRYFPRAVERLRAAGYREAWVFTGARRRSPVAL